MSRHRGCKFTVNSSFEGGDGPERPGHVPGGSSSKSKSRKNENEVLFHKNADVNGGKGSRQWEMLALAICKWRCTNVRTENIRRDDSPFSGLLTHYSALTLKPL